MSKLTIRPLFRVFLGRSTFFACLFAVTGIVLAFLGKLTADYVGLVAAVQALIVAHSVKEDVTQGSSSPS